MAGRVQLLLVRHGQTEWNAARRWQGHRDSPLTGRGRLETEACADLLAEGGTGFGSIVASSLGRAVATAEILATRLGIADVMTDDRLREARAGAWEGMLVGDIEATYPGWLASGRRPGDFEGHAAVVERAAAALRDIAARDTGPVLVVTHSGLIRRLTVELGDAEIRVPNLGGIWVRVGGPGGDTSSIGALASGRSTVDGIARDLHLDRRFDGPTVTVGPDRDDPRGQTD